VSDIYEFIVAIVIWYEVKQLQSKDMLIDVAIEKAALNIFSNNMICISKRKFLS
ncbi:hypothetical protein ACJX0J_036218, partial [Zea mays]